jgi:peptidoglycan hydrolase-like protein with peptidoglycan-binding domain
MSLLTLYPGSKGKSVSYCQERLNIKGYHVSVTGDFDAPTVAAVKQFQSAQGLVVDGIVGSRTWAALKVDTVAPTPPDVADEGAAIHFSIKSPPA